MLAFVLVGSIVCANNTTELSNFNYEATSEPVKLKNYNDFLKIDICTITVSTVDSDGNVINSVTVTNHEGDCAKAEKIAYLILGLL